MWEGLCSISSKKEATRVSLPKNVLIFPFLVSPYWFTQTSHSCVFKLNIYVKKVDYSRKAYGRVIFCRWCVIAEFDSRFHHIFNTYLKIMIEIILPGGFANKSFLIPTHLGFCQVWASLYLCTALRSMTNFLRFLYLSYRNNDILLWCLWHLNGINKANHAWLVFFLAIILSILARLSRVWW